MIKKVVYIIYFVRMRRFIMINDKKVIQMINLQQY